MTVPTSAPIDATPKGEPASIDKGRILSRFIELSAAQDVRDWARKRGFSIELLMQLRIGRCNQQVMQTLSKEFPEAELTEANLLNKANKPKFLNRIIIPYSGDYFAARDENAKDQRFKNLFPKGRKKIPFFIKGTENRCFITEGETDAIRLKQVFPDTNVFSLGGAQSTGLLKQVTDYFTGDKVILSQDNDVPGQTSKKNSISVLSRLKRRYDVQDLKFPEKYKDIDECLFTEQSTDNLKFQNIKLAETKRIPIKRYYSQGSQDSTLNLLMPIKEQLCENYYLKQPYFYDDIGFFYFWNFEKLCYEKKDEIDLILSIKNISQQNNVSMVQNGYWGEMVRALKLIGRQHKPKEWNRKWIQFRDSIINYSTGERFTPTPLYFNVNPIPHALGKSKDTPIIDKLLFEWVGEPHVNELKELCFYCMIQDYPIHRLFFLFGAGLNGKGEFLRFLRKLIGEHNICATELKELISNRFAASSLYQKLCCQMGETNFQVIADTGKVKALSGQDTIPAEYKGKDSFTFQNFAKIIIASNCLPPTLDNTAGWNRRVKIIDFPNQFPEGKHPTDSITESEYSNFCLQLIDIGRSLLDRGIFTNDGSIPDRQQEYEKRSNPIKTFIDSHYIRSDSGKVPYFEFYDDFEAWSKERRYRIMSKKEVSKYLESQQHEIKKEHVNLNGKDTTWNFIYGLYKKSKDSDTHDTDDTLLPLNSLIRETNRNTVSSVSSISDTAKLPQSKTTQPTQKTVSIDSNKPVNYLKAIEILDFGEGALYGDILKLSKEKESDLNEYLTFGVDSKFLEEFGIGRFRLTDEGKRQLATVDRGNVQR